jgi:hypothetical protein
MRRSSTEEQNKAAGGAHRRLLLTQDASTVIASTSIRSFTKSKQLYAYLQFKLNGKTITRYIGNVSAADKATSLGIAWETVRKKRIAEAHGWTWVDCSTTPEKQVP